MSYSFTTTETYTLTNAKKLAAKVTADMYQSNRLYGRPSLSDIEEYQQELVVMLVDGYLETYEFGFKTADDKRILSWFYTVGPSGDLEGGRSGGLYPSASSEVANAKSFNYMTHTDKWSDLAADDRDKINSKHPVNRATGDPPQDGNGYWHNDREYGSGRVGVSRKEFRPW